MSDLTVGNPKGVDQTSNYTQHVDSNEIIEEHVPAVCVRLFVSVSYKSVLCFTELPLYFSQRRTNCILS